MTTPDEELVDAAEMHQEKWVCGNPSHTNPEVGCPECAVVCQWCDDEWPCLPRGLADRLAALPTPQEADAALAAIERVRDMHRCVGASWPHEGGVYVCSADNGRWPCRTVAALDTGKETGE